MYRIQHAIFIFAAAAVFFNCSESQAMTSPETYQFEGIWRAQLQESWEVYLQLTRNNEGSYKGAFSSYLDGLQYTSGATGAIITEGPSIHMVFNPDANISFEGSLISSDKRP